ncbi:MAG TPA: hypothetical protein VMU49_05980 [Candidatus Acidoferrales bacterium]|nr:hypothetical protein [Candidatus Acidoferrales bacterium]
MKRELLRSRIQHLRKVALMASGAGFMALVALAATNSVGVTSKASNGSPAPASASSSKSAATPGAGGGFFAGSGGVGVSGSSASQTPVMRSGAS